MAEQYQSLKLKSRAVGTALGDSYSHSTIGSVTSAFGRYAARPFTGNLAADTTQGFQLTWSSGHPWPPSKGRIGDIGGPFRTVKRWFSSEPWGDPLQDLSLFRQLHLRQSANVNFHLQTSPVSLGSLARKPSQVVTDLSVLSDLDLSARGTIAIERCKPTRTANSLLTTLIELKRDGIPDVPINQFADLWRDFRKSRKQGIPTSAKQMVSDFHAFLKSGGSEYLNLVFGWSPLLADTKKLLETYNKLPEIWSQYERDAGRRVRRRYQFPTERTVVSTSSTGPGFPIANTQCYTYRGTNVVSTITERDIWFDGAFRYYLPDRKDGSPLAELYRFATWANKSYGLAPTPDNIWNVIPWTWALDWVSNLGSVVSNLSDTLVNGLVLEYGYVCERVRICRHYSTDFGYLSSPSGGNSTYHGSLFENVQILNRIQATPYGFGLSWQMFTPAQLAILASIGINRF